MRCLSIRQPWLELLLLGRKRIETRTWKPAFDLPAKVLLHTGMRYDKRDCSMHDILQFKIGGILGIGTLVEVKEYSSQEEWDADIEQHLCPSDWWEEGKTGLVFEKVHRFKMPITYKGKLGFFNVPVENEEETLKKLITGEGLE